MAPKRKAPAGGASESKKRKGANDGEPKTKKAADASLSKGSVNYFLLKSEPETRKIHVIIAYIRAC
jgi:hypothetical protein